MAARSPVFISPRLSPHEEQLPQRLQPVLSPGTFRNTALVKCCSLKLGMFVLGLTHVKILKDPRGILVWGCFKEQVPAASQSYFLNTLASSIFCCLV